MTDYDEWLMMEPADDEIDDAPEVSKACAMTLCEECIGIKCAHDCHEAPTERVENTHTAPRRMAKCRACGSDFENPYTISGAEAYLCDTCLDAPADAAAIDRVRRMK